MTCDECLREMEDDLDGELNSRDARLVAVHLASCANCAAEYRSLRQEHEIYARYARDVELTPALWGAVKSRLEDDRNVHQLSRRRSLKQWIAGLATAPRLSPVLTACLVLFSIGLTALLLTVVTLRYPKSKDGIGLPEAGGVVQQSSRPPNPTSDTTHSGSVEGPSQQAASKDLSVQQKKIQIKTSSMAARTKAGQATKPTRQTPTVEELVAQAEQKYLAAIAIVSRDVNNRSSKLDPELRARFEEALVAIDRTIAETRRAVGKHPTDPEAVSYMLTAYAKKVEVLQEMASY